MKTADVVQAGVGFYLESDTTANWYRTIPLEPWKRAAVVLYGRCTATEMVGQVRIDGKLDDELSRVGRRENG